MAIIITVLPLWAILTTLIVFVLLAFHKNLRVTKIYDNCTKQNAQFIYHIEIRTGDTSATYNRRKTTITIDMFDDSQTTLARIAIPGHVIFGRKDSPVATLEDDKYYELRVTRLWLYRASKLKKVSTIRLTHSCGELEARIMVYGVEIRSNEPDRHKLFFPVMSYITAYGCANKPNACFDIEPAGKISAIGGLASDTSSISEQLTLVDYTLLAYLFSSIVFFLSTYNLIADSFKESSSAAYKGAILGACCFVGVLGFGLILRYVVKKRFTLALGTGVWAIVYYAICIAILVVSTIFWIYTTIIAYRSICPSQFNMWLLTISVAVVESIGLAVICSIIVWTIQILNPRHTEHYILPDDATAYQQLGEVGASLPKGKSQYRQNISKQTAQQQAHMPTILAPSTGASGSHQAPWQMGPPPPGTVPMQFVVSHTGYPPSAPNIYGQPMLYNSMITPPVTYKTYQNAYPGYEAGQLPGQYYAPPHLAQQQQPVTYQQQISGGGSSGKPFKKIGSNESTGSTYYQQLMKNKGGVKSISQYGELLRQKKISKDKK